MFDFASLYMSLREICQILAHLEVIQVSLTSASKESVCMMRQVTMKVTYRRFICPHCQRSLQGRGQRRAASRLVAGPSYQFISHSLAYTVGITIITHSHHVA